MIKIHFLLVILLYLSVSGCAGVDHKLEDRPIRIAGREEILVMSDVGEEPSFYVKSWCGNKAFLIYRRSDKALVWMDFSGNKVTVSTNPEDRPVGCSPDGKWVLYKSRESRRLDKYREVPESFKDMCPPPFWEGFIYDLYRFEVATGNKQKFAVIRSGASPLMSPNSTKILLGGSVDTTLEMPEPKWEDVRLTEEWTYLNTRWFPDSSGIATRIWNEEYEFGAEIFGKNGWAKKLQMDKTLGDAYSLDAIDKENRLYISESKYYSRKNNESFSSYTYYDYRCAIKGDELGCEILRKIDDPLDKIHNRRLLSNGDVIYHEDGTDCIWRLGDGDAICIADRRYTDELYQNIRSIGTSPSGDTRFFYISPDGRWLAFMRSTNSVKNGKDPETSKRDLFIVELKED